MAPGRDNRGRFTSSRTNYTIVVRSLREFEQRVIVALTLEIVANLTEKTPVDTSWARSNWIPEIGGPPRALAGTRADAEAGRIDLGPQQVGQARALAWRFGQGSIYISNGVPYIERLNAGSSRQAPAGYIQAEIRRAVRTIAGRRFPQDP